MCIEELQLLKVSKQVYFVTQHNNINNQFIKPCIAYTRSQQHIVGLIERCSGKQLAYISRASVVCM